MTALSRPVSVKLDELLDAFDFANAGADSVFHAYICLDTGKIHLVSGVEDLDEEIPDDIDECDRYLQLPYRNDLDLGSRLVFAFAEQKMQREYEMIRGFFRRKGAYGRFKDLLHSEGLTESWYGFEARATEDALRAWCRDNDVEVIDAEAPG